MTHTKNIESLLEAVGDRVGTTITAVARVYYEFEDEVDEADGEVQLLLGEMILRLRAAGDGEQLAIERTIWQDPFEQPMTAENEDFVVRHGRPRLVDVSDRPGYRELIGKPLRGVLPLTNRVGRLIGVQLLVEGSAMNVFIEADEVQVSWGEENVPRWRRYD